MSRRRSRVGTIALLVALAAAPVGASEAAEEPAADPLAPFARLIGGEWHLEDGYQTFEWGVGERSVRSQGYAVVEGEPKLVSEGAWFWHPGERRIVGYFTAIAMPVVFFEYVSRFEGDTMVNELTSYDAEGNEERYLETWEFTDENHYIWSLFSAGEEGRTRIMGGTWERR